MKYIRKILGVIILALDAITRPRPMQRSEEEQERVDERIKKLSLYEFHTCPFCVKVRRALRKLNLNVELRDAKKEEAGQELLNQGGKRKVPCLRIEESGQVKWMYESKDIIAYLQNSFGQKS